MNTEPDVKNHPEAKPEPKKQVTPLNVIAKEAMEPIMTDLPNALPPTIPLQKFQAAFITAAVNNPTILQCTKGSILKALMKSANDGLLPDGQSSALVPHKNHKTGLMEATYMPMAKGVIKKASEQGEGYIITVECVHANDTFECDLADPQNTSHPFPGFINRGDVVGAYAIFADRNKVVIHREIMSRDDIDKARSVSKMKKPGGIWDKWFTEMCRKTVLHRGSKYVPMSEPLRAVIERDHDNVDFEMKNITNEDYNPLEGPSGGDEDNELEQAINAGEQEIISPITDAESKEAGEMIDTIEAFDSENDLFAWQAENGQQIAELHPDVKGDVRDALKTQALKLRGDQS